jgi:hypothetical protein
MVNMLAYGPKVCGFKPGQADGFLMVTEICNMPSFRWEEKPPAPCHKILQHVKNKFEVLTKML